MLHRFGRVVPGVKNSRSSRSTWEWLFSGCSHLSTSSANQTLPVLGVQERVKALMISSRGFYKRDNKHNANLLSLSQTSEPSRDPTWLHVPGSTRGRFGTVRLTDKMATLRWQNSRDSFVCSLALSIASRQCFRFVYVEKLFF